MHIKLILLMRNILEAGLEKKRSNMFCSVYA